jgi:NAD+ diphosphatase
VPEPIVFSGSPLDRLDHRRKDADWIDAQLASDATRVLPVWRLSVLVRAGSTPALAWATRSVLEAATAGSEPVLLGALDEVAHFAIDISSQSDPVKELEWEGVAEFPDLRAIAGQLPAGEAAIAAHARHLVDWHARHGHCPGCGQATEPRDGGYVRICGACGAEHFPRTDPVVIMLVTDGERCLLGRQPSWPRPFFSALAGFVEPGESLEEAVRREVMEEARIRVGRVRYLASQPWPFPASLMLGCVAEALDDGIVVDTSELEEAAWFTRPQVVRAFETATRELAIPPPVAIAHQLMRAWALEDARP